MTRNDKLFLAVVLIAYGISIAFSFLRVYTYHAYPVFMSEDEMPSLISELFDIRNFLGL